MGVTQLWQILAPVQQHRPLSSLAGQSLAVDLSIWVCETQSVKQMQGVVSKPFLRNLFFRISHLTQLGVKLVFVVEGTAPELKWEAMMKRQQSRFPGRQGRQPQHRQGRRNFNSCLRECCELLDILGIPYVQSHGEAEAMCAVLNAAGLVDGCLTNDGDAFLYGATVVYRNFTMNTKDPHVESYRMSDIETELGIDRNGLVALGLLLGCDYVPKGVPGIGQANAVKLMQTLQGRNVLKRLKEWRKLSEADCLDQVEVLMRRKAVAVPDFPQEKVIKEFLITKDKCPSIIPGWKRPIISQLQDFALDKLEWPIEYGLEKILPLVTLWDMRDIISAKNPPSRLHLQPNRIVKARVRQGVPCYEIEWHKPVSDTTCPDDYYTTIEEQELFSQCYQQIVADFSTALEEKKAKKTNKGRGARKKKVANEQEPQADFDDVQMETKVSAQSEVCCITEELSASFAELLVNDSSRARENISIKDTIGNAQQPQKVTKHSKSKKLEETVKRQFSETTEQSHQNCWSLPEQTLECDINDMNRAKTATADAIRKDFQKTSASEQWELLPDNGSLGTLNESMNDSYIPLSLRVKRKLRKKNSKIDFKDKIIEETESVLKVKVHNSADKLYCELNNYSGSTNSVIDETPKVDGQSIAQFVTTGVTRKTQNHIMYEVKAEGTFSDTESTDNVCPKSNDNPTKDYMNDFPKLGKKEIVDSECSIDDIHTKVLTTAGDSAIKQEPKVSTKDSDKSNNHGFDSHLNGSPVSGPFSNTNTPLSLQKKFSVCRYDVKISSPYGDEFCSPVMYIKQTMQESCDAPSFIEIQDTPDHRNSVMSVIDGAADYTSNLEDDIKIAAAGLSEVNLATDEQNFGENVSLRIHDLIEEHLSSRLATEYSSNLSDARQLNKASSCLMPKPLYSAKMHNTSETIHSPLQVLLRNKLENSQTSMLDMPEFEIQTSLLNSLCRTLDQTSSPFNMTRHGGIMISSEMENSFQNNGNHSVGNIMKDAFPPEKLSQGKDNDRMQEYGFMCGDTDVRVKDKRDCAVSEKVKIYQKDTILDDSETETKKNIARSIKSHHQDSTLQTDLFTTSQNEEHGQSHAQKDELLKHRCVLPDVKETEDKSIGKTVMKNIIERKLQTRMKTQEIPCGASLKGKVGKNRDKRKVKKKSVKKVSAFMDLSHDTDDDMILSQVVSSQQSLDDKMERLSGNSLKDIHLFDFDKENNPLRNDNGMLGHASVIKLRTEQGAWKGQTLDLDELSGSKSKVKSKKYLSYVHDDTCTGKEVESSKTEIDLNYVRNPLTVSKETNICLKNEEFDNLNSDSLDSVTKNRIPADSLKTKADLNEKIDTFIKTVERATTASSPVSLADRLRNKLKNSSTRQVLTDFTQV